MELVWNGKTRDVCTTVLPFQSLEHVDEPRREKPELGTLDRFDMFDTRGRPLKGWTNKLIGDEKQTDPVRRFLVARLARQRSLIRAH